jgi:hypothetical protein
MRREYVYDVLEAFALSTGIFHPSIIGISADDVKSPKRMERSKA